MEPPNTDELNAAVRKAQIEAMVTVLEANGFQGAYDIAEQAVAAANKAAQVTTREHLRALWVEIGDAALDALHEFGKKHRS